MKALIQRLNKTVLITLLLSASASALSAADHVEQAKATNLKASNGDTMQAQYEQMRYGYEKVDGHRVFFREAGNPNKPTIVLLHGFPSSSHQYRDLINLLKDDHHLIAPDYLGFGASDYPARDEYDYSFDNYAHTINRFLEQRKIEKYSLFIQDYGSPVGMRIALKHPDRVQSIISQNGNVYEEGLNKEVWAPIMKLWQKRTPELEQTIASSVFSLDSLKWQYTHGTRQPDAILPDNWILDHQRLSRPGQHELQLDLFYDYRNNVSAYPSWQKYLREYQPSVLLVWAKNDAFFPESGAYAFKRDVKDLELNLLDTGHFALEEDAPLVATKVRQFLSKRKIP